MGKFLADMISLGIEGAVAYSSAKKKAEEAKGVLEKLTSGHDEVPIEVFLKMYDLRIHDFESKQDNIKFMKNWDFEGVYIIHNRSKEAYHVGRSSKVLRKIEDLLTKMKYGLRNHILSPYFIHIYCRKDGLSHPLEV